MSEPDEADLAAARLEQALDRIGQRQAALDAAEAQLDSRITGKLDSLIRALRTALDT